MKLALLSDIHANIQAFEACLEHAHGQGARRYAILGDLVGYGADPAAVVERVQAMLRQGALVLKGNHDAIAVRPPDSIKTVGDSTALWTHAQLSDVQRQFLDQLPLTIEQQTIFLVHASADSPQLWRYVYDARAARASLEAVAAMPQVRYIFGGHVHQQALYHGEVGTGLMKFMPTAGVPIDVGGPRRWLATIGSVGQPRDFNPQAMYALFDTDALKLTFQRVAYDHQAAANAIRRAGLPALFADRLALGQ